MSTALEPFSQALFESLEPLEKALVEPRRLAVMLRELGFSVTFEPGTLEALAGPLGPLAQDASRAIQLGRPALSVLTRDESSVAARAGAVVDLLEAGRDLVAVAKALGPAIAETDLSRMPVVLRDRTVWTADIAPAVPGFLLVSWLEENQPVFFELLRFVGIVEEEANRLHLARIGDLVDDPVGTLKARFEWSADAREWVADRLVGMLSDLFAAAGLPTRLASVSPQLRDELYGSTEPPPRIVELPFAEGFAPDGYARLGLVVLPVPESPGQPINGLLVGSLAEGEFDSRMPLDESGEWHLDVEVDVDATASMGVHVHPSGVFPRAEMPSAGAGLAISFTPDDGWRLIGGKTGSRIEIQGLALSLDLTLDDIELRLRTVGQGAAPGFAVVLTHPPFVWAGPV